MDENTFEKKLVVYKQSELYKINLENIEFQDPICNDNSYFIPCEPYFYIQLENIQSNTGFIKKK